MVSDKTVGAIFSSLMTVINFILGFTTEKWCSKRPGPSKILMFIATAFAAGVSVFIWCGYKHHIDACGIGECGEDGRTTEGKNCRKIGFAFMGLWAIFFVISLAVNCAG
jgi:hypothetical protein